MNALSRPWLYHQKSKSVLLNFQNVFIILTNLDFEAKIAKDRMRCTTLKLNTQNC